MEAFPHIDTIKYYCTDSSQLYPQSHILDFHNKADGHERRIATYLVENLRSKTDLEVCAVSTVTRFMVEKYDLVGRNIAYRTLLKATRHSSTSPSSRRPKH
jgi:hypothetical protein